MVRSQRLPITLGVVLPLLVACSQPQSSLERVKSRGELTVVTRNVATTYYEGPDGPTGMEYVLAKGFADELGVKLNIVVASNVNDVLVRLTKGEADFAAAGLTNTKERRSWIRFTPPYQEITQQLVYRLGTGRPKNLSNLNGSLEVVARSSHAERLAQLKKNHPNLRWHASNKLSSEELLAMVANGTIDYTVADSNELTINQYLYPELRPAMELSKPEQLAWAFRKSDDDSLYKAAVAYFDQMRQSGRLDQMVNRFYAHLDNFDYVGSRTYLADIKARLPLYRDIFQRTAMENNLDWRLLAAMAYQESHWNPDAVSHTGVRGIMMLTTLTAKHLGVQQREDPLESIEGGSRYLRILLDRLPERIQGNDRLWLALAAYNMGYGHLEDARVITQMRGGNPDRWSDVRANLPLLSKSRWSRRVRNGYARGNEAVQYVENIRNYYDTLVWVNLQEETRLASREDENDKPAIAIALPSL